MRLEPPVKETFEKVLKIIQTVLPFESATLYLHNKRKQDLEEIASLGEKIEPINFVQFEAGSGITAWAAQQKKPVLISHLKNKDRPPEEAKKSFLAVPLLVEDKLIGVVTFAHSQSDFFREKDQRLLTGTRGSIGGFYRKGNISEGTGKKESSPPEGTKGIENTAKVQD